MATDESPFPGPFSYEKTPYCKEIINRLHPSDPAKLIAVMKGAQTGFSTGVIEPGVGWIISENPGNILFLTGHSDLTEEAINKIDRMIDNSGLRPLIRPSALRKRNTRTGDTNKAKEFPGGSLVSGSSTNHKLLMQRSVRFVFNDDTDAAKQFSATDGATDTLIGQRLAAYASKMKRFDISTPRLKQTSNILPVYLLGDQRRFHLPCPCCGDFIPLLWNVDIAGTDGKERGGITWKLDESGKLINKSVGYVCQSCSKWFNETHKSEMLSYGNWQPTAIAQREDYYSYHLSSLYAPAGMYNWTHYVNQYIDANPQSGQIEHLQKTFVNLCLGDPFEQQGEAPKGNDLQKNIRNYEIGTIPEKLAIKDGNGEFVLLTCAADMNGVEQDARLDYEIVGWTETGASYSITHGSIGTFIPRENTRKTKEDREPWTYEPRRPRNVWDEFNNILAASYFTDTGRRMSIIYTGLDSGHYTQFAYNYVDNSNFNIVALKGKDADKFIPFQKDTQSFHAAKERSKLYLIEVNFLKDQLAGNMKLRWKEGEDEKQPYGFMNYPHPGNGKYEWQNFFEHYESEERIVENKDGTGVAACWRKKSSIAQNHLWDCRIYNMAIRDIFVFLVTDSMGIKKGTWGDFVSIVMNAK
jgi:phage terminase large subunit GpA-like protein